MLVFYSNHLSLIFPSGQKHTYKQYHFSSAIFASGRHKMQPLDTSQHVTAYYCALAAF